MIQKINNLQISNKTKFENKLQEKIEYISELEK